MAMRVQRGEFGEGVLLVRHEEMITEPRAVADAVMRHVGLEPHDAVREQMSAPTFNSSHRDGRPAEQVVAEARERIAADPDFCERVEREVEEEMSALGYTSLCTHTATAPAAGPARATRSPTTIAFLSYEIHPTTWGGAGVLLHHAAVRLLEAGHRVLFLLDVGEPYFTRFVEKDRLSLPNPDACAAWSVDELCADLPLREDEVGNPFLWKSLRFDWALAKLLEREAIDFVEFFEYCGVASCALSAKIFGRRHADTILGVRAHNSVELIDAHESTKSIDRDRYLLYALEQAGLARAESVLFPSRRYAEAYYLDRYAIPESSVVISQSPKLAFGRRAAAEDRDEVVYLGRIFEFKGVETFLHAALLLCEREGSEAAVGRPLRFVFIGPDSRDALDGGSYIEHLKAAIPEPHRERFEFTGHLDHDRVLARLDRALFGVLPNRFESFCYAAHELYDAGVPLIANDIPAFRNYFEHEENALLFDGTTLGLADAMERLAGDTGLREGLSCPRPIATEPLGNFYAEPFAGTPIDSEPPLARLRTLAVIVRFAESREEDLEATREALQAGKLVPDRILVAREVEAPEATDALRACTRWLGRQVVFETAEGEPIGADALRSLAAIWLLAAGDRPGPECLELCSGALARSPGLGFAGCWSRRPDGGLEASTLDLAPELWPFDHGARLTRSVVRTTPDTHLFDLFDTRAGSYGELALVWGALEDTGPGAILPEVHLELADPDPAEHRPEHLSFLVAGAAGPGLKARLALHAAVLSESDTAPVGEAPRPSIQQALAHADAHLDGKRLLALALRKLRTKLGLGSSGDDGA